MRHTRLGRTGLSVSRLCLGTMTFGLQCDEAASRAILDRAAAGGITFLDTADVYPVGGGLETVGRTEEIVGRWLEGRRQDFVVATKCVGAMSARPWDRGASRKHVLDAIDGSLRRLRTDYVDLLWLHAWDPRVPLDETLRALDDLVAVGKVRYIGVCNLPAWVASRAQTIAQFRSWSPVTAMQIEYSLIERTAEGELLPMATELGIGVMPYSPLRGGRLSGKYKRDGNIPDSARAVILDRPTAEEWTVIDAVSDVAAELDVTPAQVALAWVAGRNAVTSTIIGARTQEQLRSNLASLAITLTPQQRHTLDAASSPTLDHPASVNAGPGPQMGFGGSAVDGVHRPTWGTLTNSAIRY